MESELTCPVCSEIYTKGLREPVLLPNCGHAFCRMCLCNVESAGSVHCPTCRKPHTGSSVSYLPTIFALLSLSENYTKPNTNETSCLHHGSLLEFWCRGCQEALCGHCLLTGHLKDGHIIETGKVFVAEKKQEILNCGSQLVKDINVKKELVIKQIKELMKQIVLNSVESEILHSSKTEAERLLHDLSNIHGIESVFTYLALIESLQTGTQKIPLSNNLSEERKTHDKCTACIEMENAQSLSRQVSSTMEEDTEESGRNTNTEFQSIPIDGNTGAVAAAVYVNEQSVTETMDECLSEKLIAGDSLSNNVENILQNHNNNQAFCTPPVTALRTKAPWPLQCCVVSNDGQKGKLRWENDKLHMYSLSRNQCDAQFMIQLCVVEWFISAENPEVFLDLGSEYHHLGRIYIRLFGYLRRAQHFLALCLGSLGPSYKYSKFHGVAKRGAPGETLAGGKYITSENTISSQGLIPELEWGGKHIREKREGLVVGASGSRPTEDAFFHICTKDQGGRKFACVFGEVVAGMHILKEAVQHMLQFDVLITDVGVVLSHGS